MTEIHCHIWLYHRDDDGVIRTMEREDAAFENRRKANYAMDKLSGNWHTAGQWRAAGQVLQCADQAFCKPPPDWVVRVVTLAGPKESGSWEETIDRGSLARAQDPLHLVSDGDRAIAQVLQPYQPPSL